MFALNSALSDFIIPIVVFCLFVFADYFFQIEASCLIGFFLYQACLIWNFIPFMLIAITDIFPPTSVIFFLFGCWYSWFSLFVSFFCYMDLHSLLCSSSVVCVFWLQFILKPFFKIYLFIYLFIYLLLDVLGLCCCVWAFSLVVASGGCSSLRCAGFSLRWLLLLRSMGSRVCRLQ